MSEIDPKTAAFCDALEWLLVPWGHRHTGRVRVLDTAPHDGLVWTNKSTDGGLWSDGPEAEIRAVLTRSREVSHTLGGSQEWVLGAHGIVARRVLRAVTSAGWSVQRVDAEGVALARIGGAL